MISNAPRVCGVRGVACVTFEVGAGAEGAPVAGDDGDAQGGLAVEPAEDLVQLVVAGYVDAVELLWAVERDEQDIRGWE